MIKFKYVLLSTANVNQDVLNEFDCGHPDFNDFLQKEAICTSNIGEE